jgi:hypothetical protein
LLGVKAFRRSLFGYRRGEVDAALAESASALTLSEGELRQHRARVAQLELVCDLLCGEVVRAREELDRMRAELAIERARVERFEQIGAQARAQATRIRMQALRDAVDLGARLEEAGAAPAHARARLLESAREAIRRLGAQGDSPAGSNEGRDDAGVFEGMVEVEVGPLEDFSQLVGFEDAAGAIGATSEISVRRFARGRATLEMRLAEPVELLRELERRSPFEFRVRDRRFDRLILDVEQQEADPA